MGKKFLFRGEMGYNLMENLSTYNILTSISCQQNWNYSVSVMWVVSVWVKILHAIFFFPDSHLHHMEPGNNTQIPEFLLLGLSEGPELQPLIFGLFLSMYLITVFGNLLIILAVSSDPLVHTPMYFFLSNLSFVDICLTSTIIPKMLQSTQTQSKVITYEGCIVHRCIFTYSLQD